MVASAYYCHNWVTTIFTSRCRELFAGIGVVIENKEHFSAWHQFLLLSSLPSLAAIIGLVFLPESPRYLLEAGREVEAMMVYQVSKQKLLSENQFRPVPIPKPPFLRSI
jgi:hypothetical protein